MSRVISFNYFCDNWESATKHQPNSVPAETVMVYSPKQQQVVEVDVCEACLDRLNHSQITDLADRMGREIEEPEYDPELVCPFGCNGSKPYKTKGGRSRHMTVQHPDWVPEA